MGGEYLLAFESLVLASQWVRANAEGPVVVIVNRPFRNWRGEAVTWRSAIRLWEGTGR